ncbi:MAG: metallophosphoesterase [Thermoguttaceae bacterium]
MILPYNLFMLAVDLLAIWLLRRQQRLVAWCALMLGVGTVAAVLGILLALKFENVFGVPRLWCFGVILHGSALLLATTVLWRKRHPWFSIAAALTALAILAAGADAFLIEPYWLEVTHYRIASAKIRRPVRIVLVADIQADSIGPYERETLRRAMDEKPDILLFAGDYLQSPPRQHSALQRELRQALLDAHVSKVPAFAVQGNVDYYRNDHWKSPFDETGVTAIDQTTSFELPDLDLTCLGLYHSFDPRAIVPRNHSDRFHLVVGHVPNFALGYADADLLLAGHTHGGQFQLPGIGPLVDNCSVPRRWASGLTHLSDNRTLIVSRGVGMERGYAPRIRFCSRPELAVIDLVPAEPSHTGNARH